jgi:YVTN family beta-propeller protein
MSRDTVSSEIRGRVSVIDVASRNILAMIEFAVPGIALELLQPVGVQLMRDGKRAFAALGPANRVAEVDQQTFEVRRYYLVGQRVWHLALSLDESRLYTTNGNSSDISVIDLRNDTVIKSIPTGRAPWGMVVAP